MLNDDHFMRQALQEAKKAALIGEVPIGAVLVINDQIVGRGHNQVELLKDATAHAEMLTLTSGFSFIGAKYLPEASLYVTVEPCIMCAGALYWSKIGKVVYGANDDKNGYRRICAKHPFHPKTELVQGLFADEAAQLMKDFFQQRRKNSF